MRPLQQQLLEIIKTKGYRRLDQPIELAGGDLSRDFVDGKEALGAWADLELAGRAIVDIVTSEGVEFDAVGGLTLGADALAVAVAAASDTNWFFIRKTQKDRGTRRWIEGTRIGEGSRVLLVDDVVTTGGSILEAREKAVGTGAVVVGAVTLVDRGERARPEFDRLGIAYFPMATYRDLGIEPVGGGPVSSTSAC